jgi:SAM-dependent methyltransferase
LGRETGIVRCRRCHGVYALPTPLPQSNPYLEHAAGDYFRGHDSRGKVTAGEGLARQAERILGSKGRLLEIGCGRGELLRGAANAGWAVHGIEITETFARIAKAGGVTVEVSPAETAAALQESWDAVILAAILEHVYDPLALLIRIREVLRPGGVVFIDVPNECSLYSRMGNLYLRLTGRDWAVNLSPTFPPFHVVGFCPASLKWTLATAGFSSVRLDLYKTQSCLTPRNGGVRARLEATGVRASLALGQVLGMGAGITCWARRS